MCDLLAKAMACSSFTLHPAPTLAMLPGRPLNLELMLGSCVCAGVKRLAKLGMVKDAPGMSALDMNTAEDMIVRNTREVVPGMVICGMEVGHSTVASTCDPLQVNWEAASVLVEPGRLLFWYIMQ